MKRHTDNRLSLPNLGGVKTLVMMLLMLMAAGVGEAAAQEPAGGRVLRRPDLRCLPIRRDPCQVGAAGNHPLDDAIYHFGASFKDLGKRLFAFELMGIDKNVILNQL